MDFGRALVWKRDDVIVELTDLMGVHLQATLRQFLFQSSNFLLTLSIRFWKVSFLGLVWWMGHGQPKYCKDPRFSVTRMFNRLAIWVWILGSVSRVKSIFDFWRLIFWPVSKQNFSRMSAMVEQFSTLALPKRTMSSAKNNWERRGPALEILRGVHCFPEHASVITTDKYSRHKMNR